MSVCETSASALVVIEQVPIESEQLPRPTVPSEKATVPAAAVPSVAATEAVIVTGRPRTEGFGEETRLVAVATAPNRVDLVWSPATNATGYVVRRDSTTIGTPSGTAFADTGVTGGSNYCYSVAATNNTGASAFTTNVCVATPSYSPITIGAGAPVDVAIWAAANISVPTNAGPHTITVQTSAAPVDASGTVAFTPEPATRLIVIFPGETAAAGSAPGKTGTPALASGQPGPISVRAVDRFYNKAPSTATRSPDSTTCLGSGFAPPCS